MNARFTKSALALSAMMLMIAMALPAVSDEHDRPDDVPPDEPTAAVENPDGEDEGAVGADTHGQTGDFDDFVSIRNQTGTGLSRLNLNTTDSQVINADTWRLANNADTNNFEISEGGTTTRAVMRQGGNFGLGTDNPLSPLHIDRTGGFQLRMQGSGADYRMDAFGTSLRIGDSANTNQFRIFGADAPFNALTVGNGVGVGTAAPAGGLHVSNIGGAPTDALVVGQGVGVGTGAPEADFDVRSVDGADHTTFRMTAGPAGEFAWANAVRDHNGIYAFNRVGTGGGEFNVRERQHATATLDVDGPVRATAFNTSSSKRFKTDVRSVKPVDVLAKLSDLTVSTWRFRDCKDGEGRLEREDGSKAAPCSGAAEGPRHIGPMAEDFQKAFGLGDGESIATVDADGILMAAIQGVSQELDAKDKAIARLEKKVSRLESQLDGVEELESRLDALERAKVSDADEGSDRGNLLSRLFD